MYSVSDEAEIGRIAADEKEIAAPTIVCPMMGGGNDDMQKPTMRESECLQRLRSNRRCRENCKAVAHLRVKYNVPLKAKQETSTVSHASKSGTGQTLPISLCTCGKYYRDVNKHGVCLACVARAAILEADPEHSIRAKKQYKYAMESLRKKQKKFKILFDIENKESKMLDTSRKEK